MKAAGLGRLAARVAVGALFVVALGAAGVVCQRVADRGRYAVAYSTYGAGPEGARGLYLLASRLGAQPRRWVEDLGRLPSGGMLVALGSCEQRMRRPLRRPERQNLRRWVEQGGILLVAGADEYVTAEGFGVELSGDDERCRPAEGLLGLLMGRGEGADEEASDPDEPAPDEPASPPERPASPSGESPSDGSDRDGAEGGPGPVEIYRQLAAREGLSPARLAVGTAAPLAGAPVVGLRRPLEIEVDESLPRRTLLRFDGPNGQPAAVRVDIGSGAVLAVASASAFQNRDLAAEEGGVLFARLVREFAPQGPVLFDEYHLGMGQRRSMMRYLRQAGAGAVVVQILLIVCLLLWRRGARFGGLQEDPAPDPAGTASYVEGVGTLYEGAKDAGGAAAILVRRAVQRIAEHHRLGAAGAAELARALEAGGRAGAAEAARGLAELEAAGPGRFGLARFAARLDRWVAQALGDERVGSEAGEPAGGLGRAASEALDS